MTKKVKKIKTACLIALLIFLTLPLKPVCAQLSEYILKAVFLERFARFIEWPEESELTDYSKPFIIAIIGEDPFGPDLEKIYSTQKIRNKRVEIRYISHANAIDECHMLFISRDQKRDLSEIIAKTRDKPILTVADTKGFADNGVYINFYLEKTMLRFEINASAVKKSKLRMSYMLLQQARIVGSLKE